MGLRGAKLSLVGTANVDRKQNGKEMSEPAKTEFVAVYHYGDGVTKIAYRSAALLAKALIEQTAEGAMVARVYERERTLPDE